MEEEELDPDTESDMEELKENLENVLGKSKLKKKLDEVKSQRSSVTGVSDIVKVWPLTTLLVVPFLLSLNKGKGYLPVSLSFRIMRETQS